MIKQEDKIWKDWKNHFLSKSKREFPNHYEEKAIPDIYKKELIHTLSILLQGETGEGRIIKQMKNSKLHRGDDYLEALDLFVKEEGRHARLLNTCLIALGERERMPHLSSKFFTWVRGIIGPIFKLLVLFSAEVMAVLFYGALSEKLYGTPTGRILKEIFEDENDHLEFHLDFFRTMEKGIFIKNFYYFLIYIGTILSFLVIIYDQKRTLKLLKISYEKLWKDLKNLQNRIRINLLNNYTLERSSI
ncbi:MAG: hypothetical protein KDK36_16630 [Leptospiraceae bacterium]|nr:hypothetical protein [Leptospiraceae bacterium]